MHQISENDMSDGGAHEIMLQNVAAGLWVVLLIGVGCFVLNAFAESARRDECVMRGAATCTNIFSRRMNQSELQRPPKKEHAGIGDYLKSGRVW